MTTSSWSTPTAAHPSTASVVDPRHSGSSGAHSAGGTVDHQPLRTADPQHVDGYRLVSRLGAGGTADVFLAAAPRGGLVVIKLFRSDDSVAMCRREFRMTYAVDPTSTAPPLGYGTSSAGAFIVHTHLPGYRTVAAAISTPMPPARLAAFGYALAKTLAAIHRRGVVHCDVKPSNLLVRANDVRVIDFGISRFVGHRRQAHVVECSRSWAAPEQLRNVPAAPPVDVFAWGCVVAYLATRVHPFASRTDEEWILRVQSTQPDLDGLPPVLYEVVHQALSRDPLDRPSATELATTCATVR